MSHIGEDIAKMTEAVDSINQDAPTPDNILTIVAIVMEWPNILMTCIESINAMKEGFMQFEAWAAQFEDPRKAA